MFAAGLLPGVWSSAGNYMGHAPRAAWRVRRTVADPARFTTSYVHLAMTPRLRCAVRLHILAARLPLQKPKTPHAHARTIASLAGDSTALRRDQVAGRQSGDTLCVDCSGGADGIFILRASYIISGS